MAAAKEGEYRKKLKEWEDEMTAKGLLKIVPTKGKK